MKNFLLSSDRSIERKVKELILATRLEQSLSKDQILELYLNEIFLGYRSFGIASAAYNYFGKSLAQLTPDEAAFLAALPTAWQNIIAACTKYSDNTGGGSNTASYVTATSDKIWLLSEMEVQGTRSYANQYEQNYQAQYDYYKAGNTKIANNHTAVNTAVWWWLRSPYYISSYTFVVVWTDGTYNRYIADYSGGLRPGFCKYTRSNVVTETRLWASGEG